MVHAQKTNLPSVSEVEKENKASKMSIVVVNVSKLPTTIVPHTVFEIMKGTGVSTAINVFNIDHPEVIGYLPSKCWYDVNDQLHMLFYVSEQLPPQARPFADFGGCCGFVVPNINEGTKVDYPVGMQGIFVDQVLRPNQNPSIVVLFGHNLLETIAPLSKVRK